MPRPDAQGQRLRAPSGCIPGPAMAETRPEYESDIDYKENDTCPG
ncbi:hypothetical protein [Roseovarius sp.]|nr:hypothetical protein [Roseovarius sp.]